MSKIQKLIARIKNNPGAVRFGEMDTLLQHHGYSSLQRGTSHVRYTKPGSIVIIVRPHGGRQHLDINDVKSAMTELGL